MRSRRDRARSHPREAPHPGPARQAHQQRFGLIVGVVPGRERVEPALLRPIAEQAVTLLPGALLDRGLGNLAPAGGEDGVRHTQFLAIVATVSASARASGRSAWSTVAVSTRPGRAALARSSSAMLSGPPDTATPMRPPGGSSASRSALKRSRSNCSMIRRVSVIASEAMQSSAGLPRCCAPRNDVYQLSGTGPGRVRRLRAS